MARIDEIRARLQEKDSAWQVWEIEDAKRESDKLYRLRTELEDAQIKLDRFAESDIRYLLAKLDAINTIAFDSVSDRYVGEEIRALLEEDTNDGS